MNTTASSAPHLTSTTASDRPRSAHDQSQVDATPRARAAGERALVLGGGGSTGNAWLIGVIARLFGVGLDVTTADLTIGTSAGSTAAAQLAGATPTELLAAILTAAPQQRTGAVGSGEGRIPIGPAADHLGRISKSSPPLRMRRTCVAEWARRHSTWMRRRTAPGKPSGASGLPYSIGDSRYIDGGYRRNENADLAAGCGRVLVLSPFGGRTLHPLDWGMQLAAQVDELRARGSRVETIFPDSNSEHMFGANAMDLSLRPPAARAGYDQGRALAEQLTEFWS